MSERWAKQDRGEKHAGPTLNSNVVKAETLGEAAESKSVILQTCASAIRYLANVVGRPELLELFGALWATREPFATFWAPSETSWAPLCCLVARRSSVGVFRTIMAPSWAVLGLSRAVWGPSGG